MEAAFYLFDNKLFGSQEEINENSFFLEYLKNNFTAIDNFLQNNIDSKEKLNYIITQVQPGNPNSIAYVFCYLYFYAKLLMQFNNVTSPLITPTIYNNLANYLSIYYRNLKTHTGFNQQNYLQIFALPDILQDLYNTMVRVKGQINNDILRRFPSANINILNGGRKNRKSKKQRKNRKSKKQQKNRKSKKQQKNRKSIRKH